MNKVKYGLSNVHVFLRSEAEGGAVTYGSPSALNGAVSLTITRESSKNTFNADNIPYFVSNTKSAMTSELEIADIPRAFALAALGYKESKDGGILETNAPVTPAFALVFQIEGDEKARRIVLYNSTAIEASEDYSTTSENIDPKTSKLSVTSIGEKVGDQLVYRKVLEKGDTGYDTAFTTLSMPEFKTA